LVHGAVLACRLWLVLFFGADFLGQSWLRFFAETQLCDFAFLKADLLAERALSLVW